MGPRALTRTQTQPWPFSRLAHRRPCVGGPDLAVGSRPKVPTIKGASFHSISCVLATMEVLKSSKVQFYLVIMSIIQIFKSYAHLREMAGHLKFSFIIFFMWKKLSMQWTGARGTSDISAWDAYSSLLALLNCDLIMQSHSLVQLLLHDFFLKKMFSVKIF